MAYGTAPRIASAQNIGVNVRAVVRVGVEMLRRCIMWWLAVFVVTANPLMCARSANAGTPSIDTIVDVLKATANGDAKNGSVAKPALNFSKTINPDPSMISGLITLFGRFFDEPIDLTPLMYKVVLESAVAGLPGSQKILFNPAHSLLILTDARAQNPIGVATLDDLQSFLKKEPLGDPVLAPYTQGFESFGQLSRLMEDGPGRDASQSLWTTAPRSKENGELVKYLLVKPLQQAQKIRDETLGCQELIDKYVDDVRNNRRPLLPTLPLLTNIMRPTRFVRRRDDMVLVLSEALLARYYIVSDIGVDGANCSIRTETPLFIM